MKIYSLLFLAVIVTEHCVAQISKQAMESISTPDKVVTKLGTLNFKDGILAAGSEQPLWDELDYIHGVDAFLNAFPAVSVQAIRKGFHEAGVQDNDVLVFSKLMDSKSLFLTANADTYYFWSNLDLSKGPLVIETPPEVLGIFDDIWWRWLGDFGVSGPDRGVGGKYLLVPPGYNGPLPAEGYFVRHSQTFHVSLLGRAFIDARPIASIDSLVKEKLKIYPFTPGGYGTTIASFLEGESKLGALQKPASPKFIEGSGLVINTIPPNDFSFYTLLDEVVQAEPAEALEPEVAGQIAAVGIVKGKPFKPDDRMKKILAESVNVANAMSRLISTNPRKSEDFRYYDQNSQWCNSLFVGGYDFIVPPPEITKEGVQQYPNDGARKLNSRTGMFYVATGITPAMCMKLPHIGSQYLASFYDSKGIPLDGSKTYKAILPKGIPAEKFWSFTVYDNQTRSMLSTPQLYPRAGSQSYPTPAATAEQDGSFVIYFSPQKPAGIPDGNWIQTMPGKGWFVLLRLYSPAQAFFDKSWRVSEIEEVK